MKVSTEMPQGALTDDDGQQALHEVQAIFQHASIGIALTRKRLVVRCNKALANMLGYAQEALIGKLGRVIFPTDEAYAQLGDEARVLLAAGQSFRSERHFLHRDGSLVRCAISASAVEPQHPEWGTIWLFDDVTLERQQQAELSAALLENQALFDSAALGIVVLKNRRVERCNPQFESIFGFAPGTMQGTSTQAWYLNETDFEWAGRTLYAQLANGGAVTHEQRLQRQDGTQFWVRMNGRQLGAGSPLSGATLWLYDDITERRRTEEALLEATTLNQVVFDSAGAAIIATDTQGVIQLFNAAAERMLGYQAQELQYQQTPALLHDAAEVQAYAQQLSEELGEAVLPGFDAFCIQARRSGKDEREWTYIGKTGQRIPVMLCVTALRASSGDITGYLGIATDITERRAAQLVIQQSREELEAKVLQRTAELAESNVRLQAEVAERTAIECQMRDMAHYDSVTGLPNRNLLRDRMAQALLQGKRDGEHVAVMFLDLDRFKNINDTLGHMVGDDLLRLVAVRLSMVLRTTDTLARIGGDEFVLVLPSLT
ncbi:MAG: PAS domain S-box protein, partial [Pseudomonadota bacterium]